MRKIIVAGPRDHTDYEVLKSLLDAHIAPHGKVEIVSGGCRGVDALGERYAKENGHELKVFPAEWDKYNKAAGPMRNRAMAKYADELFCLWDGESKGTKNMIDEAKRAGIPITIAREVHPVVKIEPLGKLYGNTWSLFEET